MATRSGKRRDAAKREGLRRVVTGVDADGRSCILSDGAPTKVMGVEGIERATQLWRTEGGREVPLTAETPEMEMGLPYPPTADRALFALIEIPPGDLAKTGGIERLAEMGEHFKDAMASVKEKRHPGMHVTDTIEYAVMLEGELTLILDKEETVLRAGDFLIQGGVAHSWANHTKKPAKLLGVQLGAVRRSPVAGGPR